jgi:hypothetical protein
MRIDLNDTPYEGVSRSFTFMPAHARPWPTCTRCGSSLAGRYENTTTRSITGMRYVVDVFRCRCGRGREVRHPV